LKNFGLRILTCGVVINEAWSKSISGSPAFCLLGKLKHTKQAIKLWNKDHFGNISWKLDSILSLLD
jgi:hypothetical protein